MQTFFFHGNENEIPLTEAMSHEGDNEDPTTVFSVQEIVNIDFEGPHTEGDDDYLTVYTVVNGWQGMYHSLTLKDLEKICTECEDVNNSDAAWKLAKVAKEAILRWCKEQEKIDVDHVQTSEILNEWFGAFLVTK